MFKLIKMAYLQEPNKITVEHEETGLKYEFSPKEGTQAETSFNFWIEGGQAAGAPHVKIKIGDGIVFQNIFHEPYLGDIVDDKENLYLIKTLVDDTQKESCGQVVHKINIQGLSSPSRWDTCCRDMFRFLPKNKATLIQLHFSNIKKVVFAYDPHADNHEYLLLEAFARSIAWIATGESDL